jgi:hypothetical protein
MDSNEAHSDDEGDLPVGVLFADVDEFRAAILDEILDPYFVKCDVRFN